jgi:transketolase N-terminal domain/subunit
MAEKLDKKETASMEELVMSQMWELQALYNLLEQKGLITKDELLEEIKRIKKIKT